MKNIKFSLGWLFLLTTTLAISLGTSSALASYYHKECGDWTMSWLVAMNVVCLVWNAIWLAGEFIIWIFERMEHRTDK